VSVTPRWLYHAVTREAWERARSKSAYGPVDAHGEGAAFIHTSYRDTILESARLYLPGDRAIVVARLDPRPIAALVRVAETPRGPMPHVHGAVPWSAVVETYDLADFACEVKSAPDEVEPDASPPME
jgi:uncharacterized protein (DUF952 family)